MTGLKNLNLILKDYFKKMFCTLNKFHGCGNLSKRKDRLGLFFIRVLSLLEFEGKDGINNIVIQRLF